MKGRMEVQKVKEKSGGVAAFFDLDGTLVALPSLEKRLFRMLRRRRAIAGRNYFLWLREAVRLVPRRIGRILQANKMYLRGVQILEERDRGDESLSHRHKGGHQAPGQASAPPPSDAVGDLAGPGEVGAASGSRSRERLSRRVRGRS